MRILFIARDYCTSWRAGPVSGEDSFGVFVAGAAAATVLAILFYFRGLKESADAIVGKAGEKSPCAARGFAHVGAVDDKRYSSEARGAGA